jgi:hypothetical protein
MRRLRSITDVELDIVDILDLQHNFLLPESHLNFLTGIPGGFLTQTSLQLIRLG